MRFLADLNIESQVISHLREKNHKASAGIVLVRMAKSSAAEKAHRVAGVADEMGQRLVSAMTVIEAHAVRRRELPK